MYVPKTSPDLIAEIYYLTEEEGGRKSWVGNGYRGQFYYNGRDWDAPQEFIDKDICNPGEKVNVYLRTLSPQYHQQQFFKGKTFEIREGAKVVGKGKILEILRDDFKIPDFNSSIITAIIDFEDTAQYLIQKLIEETNQTQKSLISQGHYYEIANDDEYEILSDNWYYDVHGQHCLFVDQISGQELEVSLGDQNSIRNLDPYFFYKYLKTSKQYRNLSAHFHHPFQDMAFLFEVLEYEQILEHTYGCEYRRII